MVIVATGWRDWLSSPSSERLSYRCGTGFFQSTEWYRCLVEAGVFDPAGIVVLHAPDDAWALMLVKDGKNGLMSLSNYYTPEYGCSGAIIDTDVSSIVETTVELAGSAGHVRLSYLKRGTAASESLIDAFERSRFSTSSTHQYENWHQHRCWGTASEYFEARPSRLRNTIERGHRRLSRDHGVEVVVVTDEGPALDPSVAAFCHVYARSWKPPENHPAFVPELIRTCARLGILRLGVLYAGGRPVAAQLWIMDRRTAHIYKLAHEPDFSGYSVGSILTASMFEHVIERDEADLIDFGMGSEKYKRDWVSECRPIERLSVVDPRRLKGAARLAGRSVRTVLAKGQRLINH